jgi:transcription antitermination factor NusG
VLKKGDEVTILGGAFKGLVGAVDFVDGANRRLRVIVSPFGRKTLAYLPFADVRVTSRPETDE